MRKLLFAILLFAGVASAQGLRFGDGQPVQTSTIPGGYVSTVPGAVINWCSSPANGVPCTNKATTYTSITLGTSCPTSTPIVLAGTTTCVGTTDGYGNWGVWVASGTYTFTITLPTGFSIGPFTATLTGGGGSGTPGGSSGQIQYNNSGAFGGFTMAGDCTLGTIPNIVCTKTNGTSFAASATTDTTNATNITSGTLAGARVAAVLLSGSGNGGVTGLLANSSLANPSVTVNGTLCTLGSTCSITQAITVNGGSSLPAPINFQNQGSPFGGLSINVTNPLTGNVQWTLSGTATEALLPAATMFTDQNFTYGAHVADFSGATTFRPKFGTVSGLPASCTTGDVYEATNATAGQNWYFCTSANTWTQQLNTGGSVPGSSTQVIFNSSGSLGASPNLTYSSPYLSHGASGTTGGDKYVGATSGVVTVQALDTAGTWTFKWPNSGGTNGYYLQTDGSGNTTWANPTTGGTVTSLVFSSPLTGGTITTSGTVGCASCVTSSSPGAGIAHFAGSTQAVTSSAVTNSDLAGSIAASKLVGTDIATVGTVTAGTWNATGITVPYGGTGAATLTSHGVLMGAGTSAIGASAAGTANQPLCSGGASANGAYCNTPVIGTAGVYGLGATGIADTGVSRDSAGVVDVGNGSQGDTSGEIQATTVHTVGSNGGFFGPEGTGANVTCSTSTDALWASSTGQRLAMCNHNTGTVYLSGIASPATANNCPKFATNGYDLVDSLAGCGGLSGLTTNVLLKATSSTTAGNSSITDNATTVSTTEPVLAGSGTTADFYSQGANQNVDVFSNNGSNLPGGTGLVTIYNFQVSGGIFSSLTACSSTLEGSGAKVTDSTTATWGATITGSGSNHVLAYCDGTNWTVAGK